MSLQIQSGNWLLMLPRIIKRIMALAMDACLCVITVWMAYSLRLDTWHLLHGIQWLAVGVSLAFALPLFIVMGLYRAIFRYAGWGALMTILKTVAIYAVLYITVFTAVSFPNIPRTIGLLQPILLLLAVGGSRLLTRYWLGGLYHAHIQRNTLPKALIYGAGSAGRQLADGMANSYEMRVVGFLDDDVRLHSAVLNGLPIYAPRELSELVSTLEISHILLAIPSASRERRNNILDLVRHSHVSVRTLPGLNDIAQGKVNVGTLRDLDIEDLLGREAVQPNSLLLSRNIFGKTVLVTGAGGSIGSELCRQIISCHPKQLVLVEQSEFALYTIQQQLLQHIADSDGPAVELIPLLASVRDAQRMDSVFSTWRPQTVYHAAAYKHVPLVEHNPVEGIRNNVFGTLVTAETAARYRVSDFVLISTDKAVRPTNIMGATKRLAEIVLQALAHQLSSGPASGNPSHGSGRHTRFSMVRFGNVLGSSGSVVPLFRQQIRQGGPITLTHADITRYFMTIPEAAQLVIQAGAMATGGDVFLLDMGEPVKIIDLAHRMVELSGLTAKNEQHPDGDIEIRITELRPGEKLYEELLIGDNPEKTEHPRIMKAHEEFMPMTTLTSHLETLRQLMEANDVFAARALLARLVPDYSPDSELVDLIHLACESQVA